MMSPGDLNNFIYRVHYEVEAMKHWGFSINTAMEDHAQRLDFVNVTKVKDEMEGIRAELLLVTSDVKKVMTTLSENDQNIKQILNGVTQEIGGKLTSLEAHDNKMLIDSNRRFAELEHSTAAGRAGPRWRAEPPRPGASPPPRRPPRRGCCAGRRGACGQCRLW